MVRYKLASLLTLIMCASALASAMSVRITSPTNGSTVSSPVRIAATAYSSYAITGWRVYVDSKLSYSAGAGTSISTSLPMTAGKHSIVVRAWNKLGHSASATVSTTVSTATPVSVAISPASATVKTGQMMQFSATVSGSSNTSVQWLVNGLAGGDSASGTISASGLYTAPAAVPSTAVTITANSSASPSASANAIVTVVQASTSGANYYVSPGGSDSNSGTASAPWRTISHSASFVKPGDTVHVAPGTYAESVILNISGGTSTAHIRYISDVKWGAKITGGYGPAFQVRSGPYVDIIGFEVTNTTGTQGIETYASGGRILGNLVHNVGGSSAGGAGIHTYPQSTVDVQIIGNVVHDIGNYLNPNNWQVTQGIYIESTRAVVENNLVYRNEAWGIHLFHTPYNVTVTNNTVFENGWGGIIVSGTSSQYTGGSGQDDYTTVSNNIVMNNGWHGGAGRGGILEEGSSGPHNVYFNNLLWNNQFQGTTGSQINIQTGTASGNIGANPQFVNYQPDGSGNYQLSPSSPAIDSGTAAGAASGFPGPPHTDLQGGSRPLGANYDIGAYEYQSVAATWPWY